MLRRYLPAEEMDLGRYPDRRFFWGIAFTVQPRWANIYFEKVIEQRNKIKPYNFDIKKTISISSEWIEKLSQHDFKSKCKCRIYCTNRMSIIQKKLEEEDIQC